MPMAVHHALDRRPRRAMDVRPLVRQFDPVLGRHRLVGGALPDRHDGPRAGVAGGVPDQIAPFGRGFGPPPEHGSHSLPHADRGFVGQTRDDAAPGEHIRVCRQQSRRHGSAGGQTGHVDPARIDGVVDAHPLDHLADRGGLALVALDVARLEPVEAPALVVRRASVPAPAARSPSVPPGRSSRCRWRKPAALWPQPCSTTTSGAPSAKPSGTNLNMTKSPGLAPGLSSLISSRSPANPVAPWFRARASYFSNVVIP